MIEDVLEFHKKFELPTGETDILSENVNVQAFRASFIREEFDEFVRAVLQSDRVAMFDALLDLEYVIHGTALYLGIDPIQWRDGAAAVHQANMGKERATDPSQSKRGSVLDVIKPDGWVGPEKALYHILKGEDSSE